MPVSALTHAACLCWRLLVSILLTLHVRSYTRPLFLPPNPPGHHSHPRHLMMRTLNSVVSYFRDLFRLQIPLRLNAFSLGSFLKSRLPILPHHQNWLDVIFLISKRSHTCIFLWWCYVKISAFLICLSTALPQWAEIFLTPCCFFFKTSATCCCPPTDSSSWTVNAQILPK